MTESPEGGEWNYDSENRKPPKEGLSAPQRPLFEPDDVTREVLNLVAEKFGDHFGDLEPFQWPVTRDQAEQAADAFFAERLPKFGDYQDAMVHGEDDLFHSMLSTSINVGLLDPVELCRRAEEEYNKGNAPLNAVEGFIRQLIGWREYVRGFYWRFMPGLESDNALNAQPRSARILTGLAKPTCAALQTAIARRARNAHAHHIQRLMVLGNFALIAGISPRDVQDWYLAVYADAFEMGRAAQCRCDGALCRWRKAGEQALCGERQLHQQDEQLIVPIAPIRSARRQAKARARSTRSTGASWIATANGWKQTRAWVASSRPWDRMGEDKQREYLDSAEAFLGTLTHANKSWARAG